MFAYNEVWLNALTFLGRARDLKMTKFGTGDYRDKNEEDHRCGWARQLVRRDAVHRIHGMVRTEKGLDYFVFPIDWRRSAYDVGTMFIAIFCPISTIW